MNYHDENKDQTNSFRDNQCNLLYRLTQAKKYHKECNQCALLTNEEELKYEHRHYHGSFHKGLPHDSTTGHLLCPKNYQRMVRSIVKNKQHQFSKVKMASDKIKLANPFASQAGLIVGLMQKNIYLVAPPTLSSCQGAAEMIEVYAHAIARDIPFVLYHESEEIQRLLQPDCLNSRLVLCNLKNAPADCSHPFTSQTVFRGPTVGELDGPYISQLLLLKIKAGALTSSQDYLVPPTRNYGMRHQVRVEWGINSTETIKIQNGELNSIPNNIPGEYLTPRYIYSGRALAEVVHNDAVYQLFYQAAMILAGLGAKPNPSWPVYQNQSGFVTNGGIACSLSCVADIAAYGLKHAWYWKWQHYRKLRPEVFALWIHNVKTGKVSNDCYEIASHLFNNKVLEYIKEINYQWDGGCSYTLPLSYHEGSPTHPAYPAGHAVIAGACATILKMFYDSDQPWKSIKGVQSGSLSGIPGAIVQADVNGKNLIEYDFPVDEITVGGEINKLASNVTIGRDWAGVHYRSDGIQGMYLGEKIAIYYMRDLLSTMVEKKMGTEMKMEFRKFNGKMCVIRPTVS